eukprot:1437545-Rhodomonas_salina.1
MASGCGTEIGSSSLSQRWQRKTKVRTRYPPTYAAITLPPHAYFSYHPRIPPTALVCTRISSGPVGSSPLSRSRSLTRPRDHHAGALAISILLLTSPSSPSSSHRHPLVVISRHLSSSIIIAHHHARWCAAAARQSTGSATPRSVAFEPKSEEEKKAMEELRQLFEMYDRDKSG